MALYSSHITGVRFHLAGSEEIRENSYAKITSPDLFRNNLPYPEGVYDVHTGTSAHEYRCGTCYNNKANCLGHPGHIDLKYPVWNPDGVADARKWLKLICFKCGLPIIAESEYNKFGRMKRLDEAAKIARTANKRCVHCNELHPIVKKDNIEPLLLYAEVYHDKKLISREKIYPHVAKRYLEQILDETVIKLGKNPRSRPRHFILTRIEVPPITIRPDVKKMGGGRSTTDDLTTSLQIMIKKNASMPAIIPENIDAKLEKAIFEINNAFYDFVRATGDNAMNSIYARLKGKQGRFRRNMLGKRCHNMCRSTIVGSTQIKIDEVGVPLVFARTIQYEETVQEYNKKQLLIYIQNGHDRYPGASKIIKKSSGKSYDVASFKDIDLEPGDTILRDMIDGDPVNFNRQPSLKPSNISTHKAVVLRNPSIKTLVMNPIACVLYNADFDGDQMNLIISAGIETRNEISELSGVANWFISHTSASPPLGQLDDSIIGTAELTRSHVTYDKYHAMLLFQNTTILPSFSHMTTDRGKKTGKITTITGRDATSMLLVNTPVNFTRVPEWYKPSMSPFIRYKPDEIKVVINQGKLISGILDKKSIGKNANGGLYHVIANDFGANKALDVMYNMQQTAVAHMKQIGYTIGVSDLLITQEAKEEIDAIESDIINQSRLITEELHNGEIIPPIGKTVEEFYEERQINILSKFDDFTEPILRSINPYTNNLFKLIMFGSKGKMNDMFNMMSAIGQKLINGERIRQKFGYKRSLVYFPRFDTTPESRGYIMNSYLAGMKSYEYVFNAMAARFDLITKALSTSITGEQMRKSIKNLESNLINNYRWVVKNLNIIQFAYGEDFLDPRAIERVKFPTVMISDAIFKETYFHADYPEFFAEMENDRRKYREIFLKIENINVRELMTDERYMPVNVPRVIDSAIRNYKDDEKIKVEKHLPKMMEMINDFIIRTPYVLINEIQEARKSEIPEYIRCASWLMCMLIRSYLHPAAIVKLNLSPDVLKIICDTIRLKYSQALIEAGTAAGIIAAQGFSEPLTQYMLDAHHRSASGGTSKSGIISVKEILGAKELSALKNPTMLIPVDPKYQHDKVKVQEIANTIEVMRMKQFAATWQVYFEKYGEPIHSRTIEERAWIEEFNKNNPLLKPPSDLVRWCLRLTLNKTSMILKNMPIELIITRIRDMFPDTYVIYTPENAPKVVLRIYMRAGMFKNAVTIADIIALKDNILAINIRGVNGILNTKVVKMIRNETTVDGEIKQNDNMWGISASGSNLRGVFAAKNVDKSSIQTDAIQEIARVFGIEAARQKIISEMRNLAISDINPRQYMLYADEMTYTGKVTSIESSGLKTRESSNILLRIGASSPMATLEEAALNSMEDAVTGVTAPLLVGTVPTLGTLYNSFHVNVDFVKKHVKKPEDLLAELM